MASSDVKTASPIAVPSPSCRRPIPRSTTAILSVGGTRRRAPLSKLTRPTRTPFGTFLRKVRAASCAAARRDGATSVASIDSEVSMARTTTPRLSAVCCATAGLASERDERDEPEQQPDGGQVPAPAGPLGGDRVEQGHGREAHDVAPPAQLRHDVRGQQQDRQEQEPEPGGGEEGQGEHQRRLPERGWRRRAGAGGHRRSGPGRRPSRGRCGGRGGGRRRRRSGGPRPSAGRPPPRRSGRAGWRHRCRRSVGARSRGRPR